jgi:hypothetical protein
MSSFVWFSKLSTPLLVPFEGASNIICVKTYGRSEEKGERIEISLGDLFQIVGRLMLSGRSQIETLNRSFLSVLYPDEGHQYSLSRGFTEIMYSLVGKGLIDIEHRGIEEEQGGFLTSKTQRVLVQRGFWTLTEYGKRQFGLLLTDAPKVRREPVVQTEIDKDA